jgi:hypothetical protein
MQSAAHAKGGEWWPGAPETAALRLEGALVGWARHRAPHAA